MSSNQPETIIAPPRETIKFFVNEEEVVCEFEKPPGREPITLEVHEILQKAGFTPAEDWELTRDRDNRPFDSVDQEVPLEQGEHFTATFKGPTPAS